MPVWVASASASRRGSHASMASPETVEIRAGTPDPIPGPAVGAIEPVTSMVSSVVIRVVSRWVLSGSWVYAREGTSGRTRMAERKERSLAITARLKAGEGHLPAEQPELLLP